MTMWERSVDKEQPGVLWQRPEKILSPSRAAVFLHLRMCLFPNLQFSQIPFWHFLILGDFATQWPLGCRPCVCITKVWEWKTKATSLLLHAKALLIALGLLQPASGGSSNSQSLFALHRQRRFYSNFKGVYHLHPNREKAGWRADQIAAWENRETDKAAKRGVKICRKPHA